MAFLVRNLGLAVMVVGLAFTAWSLRRRIRPQDVRRLRIIGLVVFSVGLVVMADGAFVL